MPPPTPLNPLAAFSALDPELPLALLPVRMETRWLPDGDPTEVRVRLFPDVVHADGHVAELSPGERRLGSAYWRRARSEPEGQDVAFAWLAAQLGPWRAAWVAGRTRREGEPETIAPAQPVRARLLPERFAVVGFDYSYKEPVGTWWGAPIPADLAMAPGPVDAEDGIDGRGLLEAQGLAWTFDFEEAERVGMALRIDLSTVPETTRLEGFKRLLAIGVRAGDQREAVEQVLEAHRYTHGLDFVPQGTPTNSTETARAGISNEAPDLAALRAVELDARATPARPAVAAQGDLYRGRAGDAASIALGLGRGNALDRASQAALDELAGAEAMTRTLWAATGGNYLDALMQGTVTADGRTWLRDWSTSFVRGAGPLPTLLVGPQPYGLLPVALVRKPEGEPGSDVAHLEDTLRALRGHWNNSLSDVPRLDPDAADIGEDESERAAVASQVLAAVPHGLAFRLARVDQMKWTYHYEWERRLFWVSALAYGTPDPDGNVWGDHDYNPAWRAWTDLEAALVAATSPDDQLAALEVFVEDVGFLVGGANHTDEQDARYAEIRDYAQTTLVALLEAHVARTEPAEWLAERVAGITRLMGDVAEPDALFALRPYDAAYELPLVAASSSEDELFRLHHLLTDTAQALSAGTLPQGHGYAHGPLLTQIVNWSAERALGTGDVDALVSGLLGLEAARAGASDPVGELERLLREGVGPWSYRLDAWYTGVGAWRLENKRKARPRGIQVGAFGWLVDVQRRAAEGLSQGYVLAPSLTHATTAAILRNGWAAFGAGLETDLSSDRIRRARWITEGVRAGQDLARLLGARFERELQDAGLAMHIDAFRAAALRAVGSQAPPNEIVDGLLLARGRLQAEDSTDAELAAATEIQAALDAAPARDRPGLKRTLDTLAADLDAVADASIAQTVFSLAQGNLPEATATLTAATTGEITFPELRFADTPREARTITHRLLLLLDPEAKDGWPAAQASGRAGAAPALEQWLTRLLGKPDEYPLTVSFDDRETGKTLAGPFEKSLASAGLSALDAVFCAPVGEDPGLGRLGSLLAAWAEGLRPPQVPADAVLTLVTDRGDPSVDDLALACRPLRRLLAEARDLDGRDLATPGAEDASSGFAELVTAERELAGRVNEVRGRLAAGRDGLSAALPAPPSDGAPPSNGAGPSPARGDVRAAMLTLSGFELAGGVPKAAGGDALVAEGAALLDLVVARLADHDARVLAERAEWGTLDASARIRRLCERLHRLVGHPLPVAPQFAPANAAALEDSFGRARLSGREHATGWLAAAGRVDPGARRLRLAVDLVEAARDEVAFDFSLGQLPDHELEGWAAVELPEGDDRGRLCLLATGEGASFAGGPVCGLVLGSWTETLARPGQTAGVAVNFDAPSARAPQAILLCSVPTEDDWDFDAVVDLLDQTLDLAQLRMVGPETLDGLGQYLPATYLPFDTESGGTA